MLRSARRLLPPALPPHGVRQAPKIPSSTGIQVARPTGFEPVTFGSVATPSRTIWLQKAPFSTPRCAKNAPEILGRPSELAEQTRPVRHAKPGPRADRLPGWIQSTTCSCLASGDALHQARVNFDIRRPLRPVGVEEARGEQERRALVGLG